MVKPIRVIAHIAHKAIRRTDAFVSIANIPREFLRTHALRALAVRSENALSNCAIIPPVSILRFARCSNPMECEQQLAHGD